MSPSPRIFVCFPSALDTKAAAVGLRHPTSLPGVLPMELNVFIFNFDDIPTASTVILGGLALVMLNKPTRQQLAEWIRRFFDRPR